MTVLAAIQRSVDFLAKKGVDSPRLQAELLLAHVLGVPRLKLYLDFERVLTAGEQDRLRELVQRRGRREPLQHILGSTSFCGLEIAVNGSVLIPRPETELLAELGWQYLSTLNSPARHSSQAKADQSLAARMRSDGGSTTLDFGTGSGCLAIALAVKSPAEQITALDISPEALAVARQNAARHQVESRIQFFAGDGFAVLPPEMRFDLIVANPPYIPGGEIAGLEPEVRDHDPRLALDGGADGLDFYRRLAREAGAWLKPDARLMLEFGDGQAPALEKMFGSQKWIVEAVKADYSGRPRILTARRDGTS